MKKPKTRRVKSKQVEEWIKEGRAILRNDLRPTGGMYDLMDYYVLDDEGLLIRETFEARSAILYEKYSEYLVFSKGNQERAKRAEQTPDIKDVTFPSYLQISFSEFDTLAPRSAKQLEEAFSLKKGSLDYSMESLKPLGNAIKKILKEFDSGDFEDKYLVPITAYCGEVMRREINGEWKVTADAQGMVIQVLILEKGNAEYSYRPEMPLVLILSGDAPSGSNLQIEVKAQLGKYGFNKGNEEHYGIKPKTKQIKLKQIEEWIQEGRAVLRNDLRPEYMEGWSDYYLFDEEGLLIRDTFEARSATLYEKYSEYLVFSKRNQERAKRAEQTPDIKDVTFPSYLKISFSEFDALVPQSAQQLEEAFSLRKGSMDYSIESLKPLGGAIKKILKEFDSGDFEDKYLVPITAYCGEVMRREINGEWKVTADAEGMVNQVLVVEKGKPAYTYRPEMPIVLILSDNVPSSSNLQIEVKAQLGKYGFIKGNEEHYGIK